MFLLILKSSSYIRTYFCTCFSVQVLNFHTDWIGEWHLKVTMWLWLIWPAYYKLGIQIGLIHPSVPVSQTLRWKNPLCFCSFPHTKGGITFIRCTHFLLYFQHSRNTKSKWDFEILWSYYFVHTAQRALLHCNICTLQVFPSKHYSAIF